MAEKRLKEAGFERRVSGALILSLLPLNHSPFYRVRVRDSINWHARESIELNLTLLKFVGKEKTKTYFYPGVVSNRYFIKGSPSNSEIAEIAQCARFSIQAQY